MNFYEAKLKFIKNTIGKANRVLSFDLETLVKDSSFLNQERIIAISVTTSDGKTDVFTSEADSDEEEYAILKKFNDLIGNFKPEVITGFNHAAYDIPLIYTKLVKLSYSRQLWHLKFFLGTSFIADMMYICAMDLFPDTGEYKIRGLRKVLEMPKYLLLPLERKKDLVIIDGKNIAEAIEMLWKSDRNKFIQYCEGDTKDVITLYDYI
ncbi:DNA polymerase elongation subunit, partial [mine drainage metagenome]